MLLSAGFGHTNGLRAYPATREDNFVLDPDECRRVSASVALLFALIHTLTFEGP